MGYNQIIYIEIECDYPNCNEYLLFSNEGGEKIQKMMRSIGWTSISFPGENKYDEEFLCFCAECKKKDPNLIENHKCIYMRKTRKGTPSEYGTILECYFCRRLK